MSQYLVDRIEGLSNVKVVAGAEIAALEGRDAALESICLRDRASGAETWRPARHLFSFIGAEPNTDWLAASGLKRNAQGFLLTGEAAEERRLPLETSREGVFAIGDVRAGSVKRVASAVGDGAQVVAAIHSYLAKADETAQLPEPAFVIVPA